MKFHRQVENPETVPILIAAHMGLGFTSLALFETNKTLTCVFEKGVILPKQLPGVDIADHQDKISSCLYGIPRCYKWDKLVVLADAHS